MSLVDESGDLESHLEETPDPENLATPQEPMDDERQTKAPERPGVLDLPEETPKALEYLNQLGGTVTQRGELVSFIAEDLETKIKLSSPGPKEDYVWKPPSFDINILNDLEIQASQVAASVDSLTENLAEVLHGMSALTVDCLETYRDVVCKACDSVDMNIKSMYQLMAKCEELSIAMAPIYKLSAQIKNIKHLLDVLESITG